MSTIERNVRDLDSADRRALEHALGLTLHEDQALVVQVIDAPKVQPTDNGTPTTELPDWTHVYQGLTPSEIDRLDQAVHRRLNLTRSRE